MPDLWRSLTVLGGQIGNLRPGGYRPPASLPFALGLRLPRHRIFERLRDVHVADLHRLHRDAPWVRFFVQDAL